MSPSSPPPASCTRVISSQYHYAFPLSMRGLTKDENSDFLRSYWTSRYVLDWVTPPARFRTTTCCRMGSPAPCQMVIASAAMFLLSALFEAICCTQNDTVSRPAAADVMNQQRPFIKCCSYKDHGVAHFCESEILR